MSTLTFETLQQQLFRYAQDLQDLMAQQSALQQRYKVVLQALVPAKESEDLLLSTLLPSMDMYIVTDGQGVMRYASPMVEQMFFSSVQTCVGKPLADVVAADDAPAIQTLLDGFSQTNSVQGIGQRTFAFKGTAQAGRNQSYETYVMQVTHRGRMEIYWLLVNRVIRNDCERANHQLFLADCVDGLMITDHAGDILEVNRAFTRISGYEASEVLGNNPRMLTSGLQGADFYQDFWSRLLDTGRWTGELFNRRKNGHLYFEWMSIRAVTNERAETVAYWAAFSDMSTGMGDRHELTQLAYHDSLTGLPNRRLLETRLAEVMSEATEKGTEFYILVLDLNRFKLVNDRYGHDVGDQLLRETSSRLLSVVRRGDTVARIGGDEFVIVLHHVAARVHAEAIADAIGLALAVPFKDGCEWSFGASIGGACFPQDGSDTATLLKRADAAMYGAKRFGLPVCFYDSGEVCDAPILESMGNHQP